ncbi:amino acid ABC transporter substrate-binding protein [Alteromonas sediminis]|uniref:Amino acid ABC transporter substrate-binding protein n=1 Tax=Alteromonas sediminis TaxID=2259342 RepID=A0A3N5Y1I0_9ALTE|nr:amino acid ABC transporter substrate-binding protein [Alteromonas sediminis]RPJ67010.1 amino acid ABC transporter substrate-binding protein [Alteromonas sediminis]
MLSLTLYAEASSKQLTLAVGHDHNQMVSANYPIYRANWEFITESLSLLDYEVTPIIVPWARAKLYVQQAQADGLFLAANLEGRDNWAVFSQPLGYGVFGGFYHINRAENKDLIASVRVGDHDRILAKYHPKELLEVATAQEGLRLLFLNKIDRLIMSESYGLFLLDTELNNYKNAIAFDPNMIERRSVHIAFSKEFKSSLQALDVVNSAIHLGLKSGLYKAAMKRNNVPLRMQLTLPSNRN